MRMMNGTPPIPAYYAAIPGLDIIGRVGVERIREKSRRMTAHLLDLVDERGWRSHTSRDPARVAGTVAVDVPERALTSRGLAAGRPRGLPAARVGLRVAHFYNTFDELDRVVQALADVVKAREFGEVTSSRVT